MLALETNYVVHQIDYHGEMTSSDITAAMTVDASGLLCPEPVLKARQAMTQLEAGQTLLVVSTDPHAELDLEVFCARTGHLLAGREIRDNVLRFWIQKGAG